MYDPSDVPGIKSLKASPNTGIVTASQGPRRRSDDVIDDRARYGS